MRTAYSVETVRAAERALMARLPEGALMQRAAAGLAAACADLLGRVYGSRVVLLVGSGDNGGDALYAGARLARRGAGVTAVLLAPGRAHAGGLDALRRAGGRVTGADDAEGPIARADLVMDGIVGIGGKGGLRPDAERLVGLADRSRAAVVAVDLPSGVEADTGEVRGAAVRADLTVTFGTYKPGLLVDPAREYAGIVRLVDIGLELPGEAELEALQHADVARLLPSPAAESDKYRRGVVGIAAGSARYPGAAVLAVSGALRGGAGAVRYVGPAGDAVIARFPETLVSDAGPARAGRVQAWVVGPAAPHAGEGVRLVDDGCRGAAIGDRGRLCTNGCLGDCELAHASSSCPLDKRCSSAAWGRVRPLQPVDASAGPSAKALSTIGSDLVFPCRNGPGARSSLCFSG
ncbi:NAD(P)H-hydrate epimerase [Streptomyces sp. 900105245]